MTEIHRQLDYSEEMTHKTGIPHDMQFLWVGVKKPVEEMERNGKKKPVSSYWTEPKCDLPCRVVYLMF